MKRYMVLIMILVCISGMIDCGKPVSGAAVYSFPESVEQIKVSIYSQGRESEFVIEADDTAMLAVTEWYDGLRLIPCDRPEDVEGAVHYSFAVNYEMAFGYEDRGNRAYITVSDAWYEVKIPSASPIAD